MAKNISFTHRLARNFYSLIPDSVFIRLKYFYRLHEFPNLKHPKTFTEKLQWLKLHNRKPIMTIMVDKYAVKDYVANIIGSQYIIPTIGVWDDANDINFEELPNRFVLKCTHDSGGLVICKDKSKLDFTATREKLNKTLQNDYYITNREWPYKNVPHRIIAEQFMEEDGRPGDLPDYKFFCFAGEPKFCQVIRDRNTKETIDFYDMDWNHQEFVGLNPVARNGLTPVARPENLEHMKEICRKLSTESPFTRVDLYIINGQEYFGEITFYPATGMGCFTPDNYNLIMGEMLNLDGLYRG